MATQWIEDFQLKISSGHFLTARWYQTPEQYLLVTAPTKKKRFLFFFIFTDPIHPLARLTSDTQ